MADVVDDVKASAAPGEVGEDEEEQANGDIDDLLSKMSSIELQLVISRLLFKGKLDLQDLIREVSRIPGVSGKLISSLRKKLPEEAYLGKLVRLQSLNYPEYFLAESQGGSLAYILQGDENSEWKLVMGLNGKGISFESPAKPGFYLRHQGYRLKVHSKDESELFKNDASFEIRRAISGDRGKDFVSFESTNYPGFFIRHKNYEGWIDPKISQELYENDASFKMISVEEKKSLVGQVVSMQSLNYPDYYLTVSENHAYIMHIHGSSAKWIIRKGLNGRGISLESVNKPGQFLRHQGYRLKLHKDDGTALFKDDASFEIRSSIAVRGSGYVSLESLNFPNFFIRHKNYEAWIDPRIQQTLYEEDASFKIITHDQVTDPSDLMSRTVRMFSANLPDRVLCAKSGVGCIVEESKLSKSEVSHFKVVPGLNGKGVSFSSSEDGTYFLRHQGYRIKLHVNDGSQLFKEDATFEIRKGLTSEGNDFFSIESTNFPGYFLRHRNAQAWIDPSSTDVGFNWDATFKFHVIAEVSEEKNASEKDDSSHLLIGNTYSFMSLNYPDYSLAVDAVEVYILHSPGHHMNEWKVRKGLNGRGVSFESVIHRGSFLRHQGYRLKLHTNDGSQLFKDDASFIVHRCLAERGSGGYFSFESTNYPGYFIRHKNYQAWIDPQIPEKLFEEDASFFPHKISL
jgi:hypothetical protein